MRPGQIRVFDGLRVTTEHVDHFQASLHSAIQDLREVAGLGRVHEGLGVAAKDDRTITVQPGLAFDLRKNRIVLDDPQTLEISLDQGQATAFVCAKYDQIEGGETEGRTTLIWDTCALVVRATPPTAADNLVVLASIARGPNGSLGVTDLTRGEPASAPAAPAAAAEVVPAPSLLVRQGVLPLVLPVSEYPGGSIAELIRSAAAGIVADGRDQAIGLTRASLPVTATTVSVSCDVLTWLKVTPAEGAGTESRTTSSAEATCAADGVEQFGITGGHGEGGMVIVERALARVPLSAGATESPPPPVLSHLALLVRIERAESALSVSGNLVWTDISTEELLHQLDTVKPALEWSTQVAWKAIGQI